MPGNRERTESVLLAQQLRQTQTPAEAQMWQLLRNRRFCGLKFRRQAHILPLDDCIGRSNQDGRGEH